MTDAKPAAPADAAPADAAPPAAPKRPVPWSLLIVFVLGLLLGRLACAPDAPDAMPGAHDGHADHAGADAAAGVVDTWTCSMHPQVRLPEAGDCPICGMDLIPVTAGDDGHRALRLSETAMALAEIVTAPVERRVVSHEVRMVGKVAFDETRLASLTARFAGRLDRLFVDYTGVTVRAGDHMVEIYSPVLIATQQELLQAIAAADALSEGAPSIVAERTRASVEAARERLRLWGLDAAQIDALVARGRPQERVTINAPIGGVVVKKHAVEGDYVETGTPIYEIADLSRVWVELHAYESDISWLHFGQRVEFRTESHPGETFEGRVAFIDPVLDDRTRTVKVRVNVDNADGRLKPDMFVRATLQARLSSGRQVVEPGVAELWMCPMHPDESAPGPAECPVCGMDLVPASELGFVASADEDALLVIPASAPLLTGERAVVYVRHARHPDDDADAGVVFEGRDVVLGPRAGDHYVVRSGLMAGEQVVVHGAFKLDSEMQIRGKPSMMNPEGGEAAPTGGHGGHGGGGDDR